MTENYLHFDSSDYAKATAVQNSLLQPEEAENKPIIKKRENVLSFPVRETA